MEPKNVTIKEQFPSGPPLILISQDIVRNRGK